MSAPPPPPTDAAPPATPDDAASPQAPTETSDGLLAFYPNHITINRHEPDIVLSAFDRNGPLTTRYSVDSGGEQLELDPRHGGL